MRLCSRRSSWVGIYREVAVQIEQPFGRRPGTREICAAEAANFPWVLLSWAIIDQFVHVGYVP